MEQKHSSYNLHKELGKLKKTNNLLQVENKSLHDKIIEETFKKNEFYTTIFNFTEDAIFRLDIESSFSIDKPINEQVGLIFERAILTECSLAFASLYDIKSEDIIGHSLKEIHIKLYGEIRSKGIIELVESGYDHIKSYTIESNKSGENIFFINHSFGIIENNMLIGIWGSKTNITELKLKDKNKKNESWYRDLISNYYPDIVVKLNLDFKITFVNNAIRKKVDIPPSSLINKTLKEVYFLDVPYEEIKRILKGVIKSKQVKNISLDLIHQDKCLNYIWKILPDIKNEKVKGLTILGRDISELINIKTVLSKSEKKYKNLTDHLPLGVYRTSLNGEILFANPACARIFGYNDVNEFTKRNIYSFFHTQQSRNSAIEYWVNNKNTFVSKELNLLTKTGREIVVLDTGKCIEDKKTHCIYFEGTVQDITQEKQDDKIQHTIFRISEQAAISNNLYSLIEKIHHELKGLMKADNFYISFYNTSNRLYTFPYYKDQYKKTPHPDEMFDLSNSSDEYVRRLGKGAIITKDNKKYINEYFLLNKKDEKELLWIGAPLINSMNEAFGIVALKDYTNKNAYKREDLNILEFVARNISIFIEKKNAQEALNKSEKYYRDIFENTHDAILILDPYTEKIIDVNKKACGQYGFSKKKLIGMKIASLSKRPEEVKLKFLEVLQNKFISFETEQIKKDGTEIILEVNATLVEHKKKTAVLSINHDITERKKFEEELIKAKEKAEESDKLKSAFLANMSHEIRTPLNGITGFSKLLLKENLEERKKRKYAEIISNNSAQLISIINDIINISKIEAGQLQYNPEIFNLNKTLDNLINSYSLEAKNNGIELRLKKALNDNVCYIKDDQTKINQILNNLLVNALKFTDKGYIEVGYKITDNTLEFYVKDTGIGISPEEQKIIFERFRQADNSNTRKSGGTGLGLSISQGLCNFLKGEIWVKSLPNKGSIFFFKLPLKLCSKDKILNLS